MGSTPEHDEGLESSANLGANKRQNKPHLRGRTGTIETYLCAKGRPSMVGFSANVQKPFGKQKLACDPRLSTTFLTDSLPGR